MVIPVNGKQISFKAPCPSVDAEALEIDGVRYTIVDALGNAIAGQDGRWTAGSVVSVVLDTTQNYAFIQNATPTLADVGGAPADHKHAASDITSGTLGVARGGTGKASWTANRLMYPSASTTMNQLAFPSVAGSVLRQGTSGAPYWTSLPDLMTAMGCVKIETGTYTGTGTFGASTPNQLTFGFAPKLIMMSYPDSGKIMTGYNSSSPICYMPDMPTEYTSSTPWNEYTSSGGKYYYTYGKRSEDGKTLYWYHTYSAHQQRNTEGTVYRYIAIG